MTSKEKIHLTIGIPAYNEAANIGYLLRDILAQHAQHFVLEKVLVISDGSSDQTLAVVKAVVDPRIEVRDDSQRKGKAVRCNEILCSTHTDILVLLDADIRLPDREYLECLIEPILLGEADFVSGRVQPARVSTIIEDILSVSLLVKEYLFSSWNQGKNIYTCRGTAIALRKSLYSVYTFPRSIGTDAHVFLFGQYYAFRYAYLAQRAIQVKLPETFEDYVKQSNRFVQSKERFVSEFPRHFVQQQYRLPWVAVAKTIIFALQHRPMAIALYLGMLWLARFRSYLDPPVSERWDIAVTSKRSVQ